MIYQGFVGSDQVFEKWTGPITGHENEADQMTSGPNQCILCGPDRNFCTGPACSQKIEKHGPLIRFRVENSWGLQGLRPPFLLQIFKLLNEPKMHTKVSKLER